MVNRLIDILVNEWKLSEDEARRIAEDLYREHVINKVVE